MDSIAHYRITAKLGEGGMGAVYRATDTKLHRDVAVKVLPDTFAADADRLARFTREAQVLASLNHPNIAAIYGVEERALILELVDGAALADRIALGPIPIEEALPITRQIAEALEYAHEHGVVHRDLKPANIKITPQGRVKVLDFGLAKALTSEAASANPAASPTLTMRATVAGVIMGTAAYMAPEQARGANVDKRADIWAFGVVLHEMLTGRSAFAGQTISDTLAAVLRADLDWSTLPPSTPPAIRRLLRPCLEREHKRRLPDIGVAILDIDEASSAPPEPPPAPIAPPRRSWGWPAAAAFALIAAIAFWAPWRSPRAPAKQPLIRLDVDLGKDLSLATSYGAVFALSPDGTRLVFCAQGRLFTRRLDQPAATEIPGTEGAYSAFFSPDGESLAFFAEGKLKKVALQGGAPVELANVAAGWGGSWGEDGNIIASTQINSLTRISSGGGTPAPFTELAPGEITHRWPQILPGGKAVLFTSYNALAIADGNVEAFTPADRRRKVLVRGATSGRYVPSGHLLYLNRGTLFAVRFDPEHLDLRGPPVLIQDQIDYSGGYGSGQFTVSTAPSGPGTLVYRSGSGGSLVRLQWLDAAGKTQTLLPKPGNYVAPELSPDGSRVALTSSGEIWVYDSRRDTMTPLTFGGGHSYPIWTPDGKFVLFQATEGVSFTRADGGGSPQPLVRSKNLQYPWSFSGDGKRLAFQEVGPDTGFDIWTVSVEYDGTTLKAGKPEPFLKTPSDERQGSFSPDGRWIAYTANASGTFQVYVRAFPDKGGRWQISNTSSMYPRWSRKRNELFFRTADGQIMVAPYTVNGDSFVAEKPRLWTPKRLADVGLLRSFDLAPDGDRIAAFLAAEDAGARKDPNHVVFLLNFFDELRRKAP